MKMHTSAVGSGRGLKLGAVFGAAVMSLGAAGVGVAAAASGLPSEHVAASRLMSPRGFSVVPVAGDRYVEPTTSLTFLGVSPAQIAGMKITGSVSGLHWGHYSHLIGAKGEYFVPAKPFRPGETVTVTAPKLRMPGGQGDRYTFAIARPASASAARKAFQVAAREDGMGPKAASAAPTGRKRHYSPPACNVVTYKSEPNLHAQSVCMNLGVTTHGTPAGHLLFITQGGNVSGLGAGIFEPNGHLVYWNRAPNGGPRDDNLQPVRFDGNEYLALWSGAQPGTGGYGNGNIYLYDNHYHLVGKLSPSGFPSNWVDLHEFQITPQGDALIGIFDPVSETIGGNTETVLQYVVQKLSLVKNGYHISTGNLLFQWDSLVQVPVSQSNIPDPATNGAVWDYFHGNAITQDSDGNLVISSRNTWGLYKVDDTPGSTNFGHILWQVGATQAGDSTLSEPWCYQHDVVALGNDEYSLYDDGGTGPGCLLGTDAHPSRGLVISVNPTTSPAGVTLVHSYTHNPAIYSGFTGSVERMSNGDAFIDWAENPEITEYNQAGTEVKMDMTLSNWSYRASFLPWSGYPTWRPNATAQASGGKTDVWMSWNGSTELAKWIVLAGPSATQLSPIHRYWQKSNFESMAVLGHVYPWVAVEAVSSGGQVLSRSWPTKVSGG